MWNPASGNTWPSILHRGSDRHMYTSYKPNTGSDTVEPEPMTLRLFSRLSFLPNRSYSDNGRTILANEQESQDSLRPLWGRPGRAVTSSADESVQTLTGWVDCELTSPGSPGIPHHHCLTLWAQRINPDIYVAYLWRLTCACGPTRSLPAGFQVSSHSRSEDAKKKSDPERPVQLSGGQSVKTGVEGETRPQGWLS